MEKCAQRVDEEDVVFDDQFTKFNIFSKIIEDLIPKSL